MEKRVERELNGVTGTKNASEAHLGSSEFSKTHWGTKGRPEPHLDLMRVNRSSQR